MGQTLSEPVTNKETAICQDDFYKVSSADKHDTGAALKIP